MAAALGAAMLLVAGMVPITLARRRHRDGAARPWDLAPLQARAIVASVRQTRPVTDLPVRPLTIARRIGLHQYGPRIGVLVDAFRVELRAKHEDSTIAVAPPRGHKTAAVVIPRVLDAPGAVGEHLDQGGCVAGHQHPARHVGHHLGVRRRGHRAPVRPDLAAGCGGTRWRVARTRTWRSAGRPRWSVPGRWAGSATGTSSPARPAGCCGAG